ncbi:MAG: histidinol phosphatase [Sporichthyaceae bacterium]|nr:histidinol phosphatase [Sporichthyaceae bacterium]
MAGYDDDLRFAHVLADAADAASLNRFRARDLAVVTKIDRTPVTEADQTVEERIRTTLGRARPRDAILGEEFGSTGNSPRCWVIDPIDGTENYLRGVPAWATLIGLMDGTDVVVGVVTAPALNRRWWASRGAGTYAGRSLHSATRCQVSGITDVADAFFSYSSLDDWDALGRAGGFESLTRTCRRTRAFGDFWSYMLVAEGAIDIASEPSVTLWDLAAVSLIVTEAGGQFTDLNGNPGPDGGSGLATNGKLHAEVLDLLAN